MPHVLGSTTDRKSKHIQIMSVVLYEVITQITNRMKSEILTNKTTRTVLSSFQTCFAVASVLYEYSNQNHNNKCME